MLGTARAQRASRPSDKGQKADRRRFTGRFSILHVSTSSQFGNDSWQQSSSRTFESSTRTIDPPTHRVSREIQGMVRSDSVVCASRGAAARGPRMQFVWTARAAPWCSATPISVWIARLVRIQSIYILEYHQCNLRWLQHTLNRSLEKRGGAATWSGDDSQLRRSVLRCKHLRLWHEASPLPRQAGGAPPASRSRRTKAHGTSERAPARENLSREQACQTQSRSQSQQESAASRRQSKRSSHEMARLPEREVTRVQEAA
jgi:hypothetical protein